MVENCQYTTIINVGATRGCNFQVANHSNIVTNFLPFSWIPPNSKKKKSVFQLESVQQFWPHLKVKIWE